MTKIELDSSVTLYRSSDLKLGETITEIVTNVLLKDFRSEQESEPKNKWVLVFSNKKGLSLNYVNTKFLLEHGFGEYEELVGKQVTFVKEARVIESNNKTSHDVVGLFIKEIH